MIKTNIKMRVNQQQLLAISSITNRIFFKYDYKFIFIKDNDVIELNSDEQHFDIYPYKEINADLFIKTNGTCEESIYNFDNPTIANMIKDDYISNLEDRLEFLEGCKKETVEPLLKKIESLHIALKKKVEKNKNQALEITKLLEQKKDLQEKLNQANRIVKIGIDNASELVNLLDKKDEIIKERANESKGYCDLKKQIDDLQEDISTKDKLIAFQQNYIKEIKEKNSKISVTFDMTEINEIKQQAEKVIKECKDICDKKLSLKDGYISYLESKLK